jgi:hypothetical protein
MLTSRRIDLPNCICNCDKNNKYQFELICCMKAKTVIYGAYFALKLWFYRKIKGKKSRPEKEISM